MEQRFLQLSCEQSRWWVRGGGFMRNFCIAEEQTQMQPNPVDGEETEEEPGVFLFVGLAHNRKISFHSPRPRTPIGLPTVVCCGQCAKRLSTSRPSAHANGMSARSGHSPTPLELSFSCDFGLRFRSHHQGAWLRVRSHHQRACGTSAEVNCRFDLALAGLA